MTYNNNSLSAALDNVSVTMYLFGAQLVEMTRAEFKEMAGVVLAKMEEMQDE